MSTSPPPSSIPPATGPALRTLVVDDEELARARLRVLLGDCHAPAARVVAEAADGAAALQHIERTPLDVVLLDIHMPGVDGIELARLLHRRESAPAVIFVTAHAVHAVTAFELDAVDYLTKPVRAERLQQALAKAERSLKERRAAFGQAPVESLLIHDRGRAERLPLSEVLYLRSEHKYITVRTATRSLIMDGSLAELETRYAERFVRAHRNTLVARAAIRALDRIDRIDSSSGEDTDAWALRLAGVAETIVVSRRMLPAVREALREQG